MNPFPRVDAVRFLRTLPGGARPVLLQASDGMLYVVKFLENPQGPNLLFNEAVGSELFRLAGLSVPEWRILHISKDFLRSWAAPPELRPGFAFAALFLGSNPNPIYEILAGGCFSRLRERANFWKAWLLDVLCDHTDNRQAIFVESDALWLDAFFIDHGHILGGARGAHQAHFRASRYLDARVYPEPDAELARELERMCNSIDPQALRRAAAHLPNAWSTPSTERSLENFLDRLQNQLLIRATIRFLMEQGGTSELRRDAYGTHGKPITRPVPVYTPLLPAPGAPWAGGWRAVPAGGAQRRGVASVRPPRLAATGS